MRRCSSKLGNGVGIPYSIGILRKPVKDYERLALKEVTNTETVSKVTQLIMSSKALLAFREETKDFGSTGTELGSITPKVYQVPIPGLHTLIASFEALGISKSDLIICDSSDRYVSENNGVVRMVQDLQADGWNAIKVSKSKSVMYWLLSLKSKKINVVKKNREEEKYDDDDLRTVFLECFLWS